MLENEWFAINFPSSYVTTQMGQILQPRNKQAAQLSSVIIRVAHYAADKTGSLRFSLASKNCLLRVRQNGNEGIENQFSPFSATVFSSTSFKVRYFRSHLVHSFASSMFLLTCEIICLYLALALFNHVYLMFFLKRIYFAVIKHRNGSHYRANSLVLFLSLVFQSEKCLQSHFIELKEFSFGFSIAFISFSLEKCGAFFCVLCTALWVHFLCGASKMLLWQIKLSKL